MKPKQLDPLEVPRARNARFALKPACLVGTRPRNLKHPSSAPRQSVNA